MTLRCVTICDQVPQPAAAARGIPRRHAPVVRRQLCRGGPVELPTLRKEDRPVGRRRAADKPQAAQLNRLIRCSSGGACLRRFGDNDRDQLAIDDLHGRPRKLLRDRHDHLKQRKRLALACMTVVCGNCVFSHHWRRRPGHAFDHLPSKSLANGTDARNATVWRWCSRPLETRVSHLRRARLLHATHAYMMVSSGHLDREQRTIRSAAGHRDLEQQH